MTLSCVKLMKTSQHINQGRKGGRKGRREEGKKKGKKEGRKPISAVLTVAFPLLLTIKMSHKEHDGNLTLGLR